MSKISKYEKNILYSQNNHIGIRFKVTYIYNLFEDTKHVILMKHMMPLMTPQCFIAKADT